MSFKYCVLVSLIVTAAVALPINDDRPAGDGDAAAESSNAPAHSAAAAPPSTMSLPSNATAIRPDITDTFSCAGKIYGYYADVDNDCQIFHICLPVTYADGKENMFRWSFVCPDETIFSQELFTCIRPADWSSDCSESPKFVALNRQFGASPVPEDDDVDAAAVPALKAAADDTRLAVAPIETNEVAPNDVVVKTPAIVVPIYNRRRQPVAPVAADEQNVVASVKSILQSVASDEIEPKLPVPVFDDAVASESQSFGLFKVIGDDDTASVVVQQNDVATEQTPELELNNLPVAAAIQSDDRDVVEEAIVTTETNDVVIAGEVAEEGSATQLWNHAVTQSLYDGGSTVGDNVEVNAAEVANESVGTVTEAIVVLRR